MSNVKTQKEEVMNNVPKTIEQKRNAGLHKKRSHPICIIKELIYDYFGDGFYKFDDLDPVVSVKDNFDDLLIPEDHPSRLMTDTYYVDENMVLRTHTTAHQNKLLQDGFEQFLITGDVFRKDTIDKTHFPVFHQMEGLKVVNEDEDPVDELKKMISGLVEWLFPSCEHKMTENNHEFPFTDPSFEVEVYYNGEWMEILGCGVVHKDIMENCDLEHKKAYAFGLGLERLAMILFEIPDVRYFWTDDERFIKQFTPGEVTKFKPYSSYPPCYKDTSMWIGDDFNYNDMCDVIREHTNDLVEDIEEIDSFFHPKHQKQSKTYRICYRSNNRSLTDEEVNELHDNLEEKMKEELNVELRS